jgi:hypothetical protein
MVRAEWSYHAWLSRILPAAFVLVFCVAAVVLVQVAYGASFADARRFDLGGVVFLAAPALVVLLLTRTGVSMKIAVREGGLSFVTKTAAGTLPWSRIRGLQVEPGGTDPRYLGTGRTRPRWKYAAFISSDEWRLSVDESYRAIVRAVSNRTLPLVWRHMMAIFETDEPLVLGDIAISRLGVVSRGNKWRWADLQSVGVVGRALEINPLYGKPVLLDACDVAFPALVEKLSFHLHNEGRAYSGQPLPREIDDSTLFDLLDVAAELPRARVVVDDGSSGGPT